MWLIAGLGNPGPKYARNRHNIGFMVADELARRAGGSFKSSRFGGELATGMLGLTKVLLLKPMEYMNRSGFALQRTAQFYGVDAAQICVVHDEIDFPFGRMKVKDGGGHGGHNGLRSIHQQLGDNCYARVRCGVGRPTRDDGTPADKDSRVASHVLSDFPSSLATELQTLIDETADAVEAVVADGVTIAMNKFNGAPDNRPSDNPGADGPPKA